MKQREFNPLRLDVAAFAQAAGEASGSWPLSSLERLAGSLHADCPPQPRDEVSWTARGERRTRVGAPPDVWLHLGAAATLQLECQRCLGPVETALRIERAMRFVDGEKQAAELDAESEDDVLALTRSLDLRELVEDELLLALPLVPRHAQCPQPLVAPDTPIGDEPPEASPFAALAALKKAGRGH
jgi:uncharacterized protein